VGERDTLPRWRRWLFGIVAIAGLPLLALLTVELGLRVAGGGYRTSFTLECEVEGQRSWCDNPSFAWQFFPRKIARAPVSFAFPTDRRDGTYRIFVVGGSAAQGDPEPSYGFARILEVLLRERYPGTRFEVVNAAVTAINSHVVLPISRNLADRGGDLFVIYLGNNEVVGPFGAGTIFSPISSSLPLIRAGVLVRSTRLGQLVARVAPGAGGLPEEWRGMEMFLEQRVRFDDPRMESLYAHFRENLGDIIDSALAAGSDIVLSTVGTNLADCAPFGSIHRDGLAADRLTEWETLYREGVALESVGNQEQALRRYLEADAIDGDFAELQFRLAKVFGRFGDDAQAQTRFVRARDLDALRFRADTRINEIIRSVAGERNGDGVRLVDAERTLESAAPRRVPGNDLFLDHVHPTFAGNYLIARGLLEQIEALLPEAVTRGRTGEEPLTREQCAFRLALTGFDRRRVAVDLRGRMRRPPFTHQLNHAVEILRLDEEIESLHRFATPVGLAEADRHYGEAIAWASADPWLRYNRAVLLAEMGANVRAVDELRVFLSRLPQDVPAREKLSSALAASGRFEEAVAECRALNEAEPDFKPPYYTRAYALANLGRLDESIAVYRKLLEIDPGSSPEIYNEIARIEIHRERYGAAARELETGIEYSTRHGGEPIPDVYYNYAFVLKRAGRGAEAKAALSSAADHYRRVIRDEETQAAHQALAGILVETGQFEGATKHFGRAAELAPGNLDAHVGVVRSLQAQGRAAEAANAARAGIRALEEAGRSAAADEMRRLLQAISTAAPGAS